MTQTATQLRGVIKNKLQTAKGNKFVLKKLDDGKEVKVITFNAFDNNWIGETVEFEATYNSKYKNYNVEGEIKLATDDTTFNTNTSVDSGGNESTTATTEKPKRRGRPKKDSTGANDRVPRQQTGSSGRESFRAEAEEGAFLNLQSAQAVAKKLGYKDASVGDLVALADIIGRTQTAIFMDAQKSKRMKEFRK